MDLKIIPQDIGSHYNLCSIVIKASRCLLTFHFQIFSVMHKTDIVHIITLCPETDRNRIAHIRLHRCPVIFGSVTEHCVFI